MVNVGRPIPGEEPIEQLSHITEIERPELLKKRVQVDAIVAGTFRGYGVPSKVRGVWYDSNGNKREQVKEILPFTPINMALVGASTPLKNKLLANLFPASTSRVKLTDLEYRTVYKGRVRPPVYTLQMENGRIVDEHGREYKDYIIYISTDQQLNFQPSSLIRLTGYVLPEPKSQQITILATSAEFPETIKDYDTDKLDAQREHWEGWTVEQRAKWVLDEYEKYSKIVGRRNIAAATLLAFFTPTWISLNGETQRGWANIMILGDTTTGKSETVRKAIRLLEAGAIITAETASTVGLVGAAQQLDKSGWNVDWGFLVLNDRKLLAIDGAQKLYKSQWAALAESERTGIVTIAKAAKDIAYARTRQLKIANPIDPEAPRNETKSLSEFFYPAQAAATLLDLQSVARIDLCVFANSDDIDATQVNRQFNEEPSPKLKYLREALRWTWAGQAEIEFTPEALQTLLEKATELYEAFYFKLVPLASIDLKWKLARLSAALAAITLSTADYTRITVTEDHVNWVVDFIREEYTNNGLDQLVKVNQEGEITTETVLEILETVGAKLGAPDDPDLKRAYEVLEYIAVHGSFTKDVLKARFEIARDKVLRPLIAVLNDLKLIRQSRGYSATAKLNKVMRFITAQGGFSAFSMFRTVRNDTP